MTDEAPTAAEVEALIARIDRIDPYIRDAFPSAFAVICAAAAALAAQAQRIAAQTMRAEAAEKRLAVFNSGGFADADALAAKFIDLTAKIERAEAALRQAEADARRYRWLRDDARREDGPIWCVTWRHGWPEDPRGATDDLFGDELDAAIDAAPAAAPGEG